MRSKSVLVCVVAVLTLAACSSDDVVDEEQKNTSATTTTSAATTTTTTVALEGTSYASDSFVVPFTVTVPDAVKSPPTEDAPNIVSWDSASNADNKIRLLAPVEIYQPNSTTPEALPTDFVSYVQHLSDASAEIDDVSDSTIGGKPAKLMSISRYEDETYPSGYLDGTLGCPTKGADRAEGCFGPQGDLMLRLAIVYVDDHLLLLWARGPKAPVATEWNDTFEDMLSTMQFT